MILGMVLIISVLAFIYAGFLARYVLKQSVGSSAMQAISNAIKEGAEAFLKRQYTTIGFLSIILAAGILVAYGLTKGWNLGVLMTVGFLFGALCSGLAGYLGMWISIRSNIRTAAAITTSLNLALKTALRGGAVSGIVIVAMSLLGVGSIFYLFGGLEDPKAVPFLIVGFAFGASYVALFAQLGGGIYTKAADVGADLVGKVEAGIPEDDPWPYFPISGSREFSFHW
jgi:K(+)-stimulated pyrophosphate-energized sodium pump